MSAPRHRATPLCDNCGKRPATSLMLLRDGRTSAKYRPGHDLCRQCRRSTLDAAHAKHNHGVPGQRGIWSKS